VQGALPHNALLSRETMPCLLTVAVTLYLSGVQGALPHNPLVTHETDARHLRDPAFLMGALRYRVVSDWLAVGCCISSNVQQQCQPHALNSCSTTSS
jgi:acyl-CoA oxidase